VRLYVSKRKQELLEQSEPAALPLESKPAMAQVDFGEAPFLYQGKYVDFPYLVVSFPYSNAAYVQVMPAQNQECFLEGVFCNRKVQRNAIKNAEVCHPFNSFSTMRGTVYSSRHEKR